LCSGTTIILLFGEIRVMKKKYILIIVVVIIIGLLVVACVIHKHKKDHYIETQEKRIDLYFKYNLNHYSSMKV
ncbi:TPA: hypothetical protein ACNSE9_002693, partial [Staphylococcus aureus]